MLFSETLPKFNWNLAGLGLPFEFFMSVWKDLSQPSFTAEFISPISSNQSACNFSGSKEILRRLEDAPLATLSFSYVLVPPFKLSCQFLKPPLLSYFAMPEMMMNPRPCSDSIQFFIATWSFKIKYLDPAGCAFRSQTNFFLKSNWVVPKVGPLAPPRIGMRFFSRKNSRSWWFN